MLKEKIAFFFANNQSLFFVSVVSMFAIGGACMSVTQQKEYDQDLQQLHPTSYVISTDHAHKLNKLLHQSKSLAFSHELSDKLNSQQKQELIWLNLFDPTMARKFEQVLLTAQLAYPKAHIILSVNENKTLLYVEDSEHLMKEGIKMNATQQEIWQLHQEIQNNTIKNSAK